VHLIAYYGALASLLGLLP